MRIVSVTAFPGTLHWDYVGDTQFLVTAACYEHAMITGKNVQRMLDCEEGVLSACRQCQATVFAWCILPNHYHILVQTDRIKELRKSVGHFHGRSSFIWNGEDGKRGRQVWYNCFERPMKSERHFWVTMNYVHHNAVHHGYVTHWQDWPFSSASRFLEAVGRDRAAEIWKSYPLLDYGKKWDM